MSCVLDTLKKTGTCPICSAPLAYAWKLKQLFWRKWHLIFMAMVEMVFIHAFSIFNLPSLIHYPGWIAVIVLHNIAVETVPDKFMTLTLDIGEGFVETLISLLFNKLFASLFCTLLLSVGTPQVVIGEPCGHWLFPVYGQCDERTMWYFNGYAWAVFALSQWIIALISATHMIGLILSIVVAIITLPLNVYFAYRISMISWAFEHLPLYWAPPIVKILALPRNAFKKTVEFAVLFPDGDRAHIRASSCQDIIHELNTLKSTGVLDDRRVRLGYIHDVPEDDSE